MLPPLTSGSCQCSLRNRFTLRLRRLLRDDRPSFRDSSSPDSYRVAFFPTGYISWDLAYRAALLRCAELTIENGYRYFGVLTIENYSSATDFVSPGNQSHGFYNAHTAYNPPPSSSIPFWPLPALTIKMLRAPIPGVTLDAKVIRSRVSPALKSANEQPRNRLQHQSLRTDQNTS